MEMRKWFAAQEMILDAMFRHSEGFRIHSCLTFRFAHFSR